MSTLQPLTANDFIELRRHMKLTQSQMGEICEWSERKIRRIESGEIALSSVESAGLMKLKQVYDEIQAMNRRN